MDSQQGSYNPLPTTDDHLLGISSDGQIRLDRFVRRLLGPLAILQPTGGAISRKALLDYSYPVSACCLVLSVTEIHV